MSITKYKMDAELTKSVAKLNSLLEEWNEKQGIKKESTASIDRRNQDPFGIAQRAIQEYQDYKVIKLTEQLQSSFTSSGYWILNPLQVLAQTKCDLKTGYINSEPHKTNWQAVRTGLRVLAWLGLAIWFFYGMRIVNFFK